jgi:hypothetical protein
MLARILDHLVANRRPLKWAMGVLMIGLVLADILIPSGYDRFVWESVGGFGALYGFVAAILIIVVSKALGYALLYRPENYYDE